MRLIARLSLAVLAACFFSSSSLASGPTTYSIAYPTVIDGDTIGGDVLLEFGIKAHKLIRVAGVDTPELKGNGQRAIPPCEKAMAKAAMAFVDAWLDANQPISISDLKKDKYADRID